MIVKNLTIPYVILDDGSYKTINDMKIENNKIVCEQTMYCPECGNEVICCRNFSGNQVGNSAIPWYFRHKSDSNCTGVGESSIHKYAKNFLKTLVGKDFVLPSVMNIDMVPHTAYNREYRNKAFDCDLSMLSAVIGQYEERLVIDDIGFYNTSSLPIMKADFPHSLRVKKIELEKRLPSGLITDAFMTGIYDDKEVSIAIEINVSHAKSLEDVYKFKEDKIPVMEISFDGIENELEYDSDLSSLTEVIESRITCDDDYRQWLWNPSARKIIDSNLSFKWVITGCYDRDQFMKDPFIKPFFKAEPKDDDWDEDGGGIIDGIRIKEARLPLLAVTEMAEPAGIEIWLLNKPSIGVDSYFQLEKLLNYVTRIVPDSKYQKKFDSFLKKSKNDNWMMYIPTCCYKCHNEFLVWWMRNSEAFPSSNRNRLEQSIDFSKLLAVARVIAKKRNMNYMAIANFKSKSTRGQAKRYKAFCCPYCDAPQSDAYIIKAYEKVNGYSYKELMS